MHSGVVGEILRRFLAVFDSLIFVQRVRSRICRLVHCMAGDSRLFLIMEKDMANCSGVMLIIKFSFKYVL